jgi:hypothetical protein
MLAHQYKSMQALIMKEILLVGAAHGFSVLHPFYGTSHYEIDPPDELVSILGANSRVAIEM